MKRLAAAVMIATLCAGAAAAQTPVNAAQRNYKRCAPDAMSRGVEIVTPICGAAPSAPSLPGYDFQAASLDVVTSGARTRDAFSAEVQAYTRCIDTRVMGDGALPTVTLDYAACAHQFAGEQLTKTIEDWGLSCLAYEDKTQSRFSTPCFPAG